MLLRFLSIGAVLAATLVGAAPDLDVALTFGPENTLGQVTNGQQNQAFIQLANHADEELTIDSVSGVFKQMEGSKKTLRNIPPMKFNLPLPAKTGVEDPVALPFSFHSEFKTGSLNLVVYVDYHDNEDNNYRTTAYDGAVIIVEPASSIFDPQVIVLYAILIAIVGGVGYLVYTAYFPPTKKPSASSGGGSTATPKQKKSAAPQTEPTPASTDANEWIPEHHLRPRKKREPTGASSDSGVESTASKSGKSKGRPRRR